MKMVARLLTLLAFLFAAGAAQASQGSTCMATTGIVSGLTFAQAINTAMNALQSANSGSSAPTNTCAGAPVAGQLWLDTSVSPNILKMYDGSSTWLQIGRVDATQHIWVPPVAGGAGAVTAASTTNLCTAADGLQTVSGNTTITSFGSSCVTGQIKYLIFSGTPQITYNAVSMILPTSASLTMAAGNVAATAYLGGGNWRVIWVTKADGTPVATTTTFSANIIFSGGIAPAALGANTDNWNPAGLATSSFIYVTASGAINLTGIVAQTAGTYLTLYNGGSNAITLKDDVTSTAANRFSIGSDFILDAKQSVILRYDSNTTRWIITASQRQLASSSEASAGTNTSHLMTPSLTATAIAALAQSSAADYQVFTANGTWNKPSGTTVSSRVLVECWGGGGGGSSAASGGGGGGGAYKGTWFLASSLGATESVAVDTGGAVNAAGGNSTFDALTAYGGGGASGAGGGGGGGTTGAGASSSTTAGAIGGTPSDSSVNRDHGAGGGSGSSGYNNLSGGGGGCGDTPAAPAMGGDSVWGGGGGCGHGTGGSAISIGGSSVWGGGGGGGAGAGSAGGISAYGGNGGATGVAGTAPGGAGGRNAAGARGECRALTVK